jgi:3-methyladenine DNA glycosylase/8-oxoguanine DNA glycosylase
MIKQNLQFNTPEYYDLFMTCHSHGWKNLSPFEWNNDSNILRVSVFLADEPIDIEIKQKNRKICAALTSKKKLNGLQLKQAQDIIIRSLNLDVDTSDLLEIAMRIGSDYEKIIKNGAGRLLRSSTLWEDAAKTLFTTNCSWSLTKKMCRAVCSENFSKQSPSGVYPFPKPGIIAGYTQEKIQKMMPIGYRAEYFISLAKRFHEDPYLQDIELNSFEYKDADKLVRAIKGFGDYAVAHLLIMSGYYNEVPIDTVVVSYLKENYRVRKPQSFIDRTYKKWGHYKWWGLKLEKIIKQQNWLGE